VLIVSRKSSKFNEKHNEVNRNHTRRSRTIAAFRSSQKLSIKNYGGMNDKQMIEKHEKEQEEKLKAEEEKAEKKRQREEKKLMNERLKNMKKEKAEENRAARKRKAEDVEASAVVIKKRGRPPKAAAVQTAPVRQVHSIVPKKIMKK
jgi:hypothetical protein